MLGEAHTLMDLENFLKGGFPADVLLPLDYIFEHSDGVLLEEHFIKVLCQGQTVPFNAIIKSPRETSPSFVDGIFPVYTTKREFIALACWEEDKMSNYYLKPKKVFKSI